MGNNEEVIHIKSKRRLDDWLSAYMHYTKDVESPDAFHMWSGMAALSACVGRSVWIPRIKYTIYPNIYVILVAGSAQCRKSTAVNLATGFVKAIRKPPFVFAQKLTAEALIQALDEAKMDGASAGFICSSELSTFMGTDAVRTGVIPALTDFYDSPKEWTYHTRGRGKEILKNVTISFLAASTQDWLKTSIPAEAVGGGFTSRVIFVYQSFTDKCRLFEDEIQQSTVDKDNLIHDLSIIRECVKGEIRFTQEAKAYAIDWYTQSRRIRHDPKLDGYYGRKHDTMFKIAALLSISENNSLIVGETHIKRALGMLAEIEENLGLIITSVTSNEVGSDIERVLNLIMKKEPISYSDVLKHCWRFGDATKIQGLLKTLVDSKEITEELGGKSGKLIYYKINRKREE